jgi:hypothetical protein
VLLSSSLAWQFRCVDFVGDGLNEWYLRYWHTDAAPNCEL